MRVWVAEMDARTCQACESLDGIAIADNETWDEVAGVEPGMVHQGCRCFEMYFPDDIPPIDTDVELDITPQGLTESEYRYIIPLGALLFLWGDEPSEELSEAPQYQEDEYDRMLDWSMLW